MAIAEIGRTKYYYEMVGQGPHLLLISGYTCQHDYYLPVIESLSAYFRIACFDNRGVGQTRDQGELLSAELMAKDLSLLLDHWGWKNPHILGHSMGGNIAMAFASHFPDRCGKLVLAATVDKWREVVLAAQRGFVKLCKKALDPLLTLELGLPWLMGEAFLRDSSKVEAFVQFVSKTEVPLSVENMERQLHILRSFSFGDSLSSISAPALLCLGEQDLLALPEQVKGVASRLSNAQVASFKVGHSIPWEAPTAFAQEVKRFLQS